MKKAEPCNINYTDNVPSINAFSPAKFHSRF